MFIKGKVALVTGGASGLGLAYAKELIKNGLKGVTLADIDVVKGNEAVEGITKKYGKNKAIFVKLDVVDKEQFENAMKKTVQTFGNFDILINNAGIFNELIWEKVIDINLKGTINGCILAFEEYLPKYKSSAEPVILNISSMLGLGPFYVSPAYCASKSAVIAVSKVFATKENYESQKVRILTLCPGVTNTPILFELEKKSFTARHNEGNIRQFLENTPEYESQTPEVVAEAMVKIIENGENGSIWVVQRKEVFEVEVPNQKDLKILRHL